MTGDSNREMLLKVTLGLLMLALFEHGVNGQCTTPPINQVVYEGASNTIMTCNSNPSKVSWAVTSTDQELFPSQITTYSDTVASSLTTLYSVIQTDLTIKTAQSTTGAKPITTPGVYVAQYKTGILSSEKVGAKLVVVRYGPTCNCSAINSTNNKITCSAMYADGSTNPIYAKFTWTADGQPYSTTTVSSRTRVNNSFTSTSTITTSINDLRNVRCNLTFTKPQSVSALFIATNVPAFSAICTPNCYCFPNMKNRAVREGTLDVQMISTNNPCAVAFKVEPTSDEFTETQIAGSGCTVDPTLTNLYYVNRCGLIIRNSTTTENGQRFSTSGLYIADRTDNGKITGAKLVVLRNGPDCSYTFGSDPFEPVVSCTVAYADSTINPIPAIITWIVNGVYHSTESPYGNKTDLYVFTATSTITVHVNTVCQCILTFGEPTDNQYDWIATNAPEFNASCSVSV